jgi:hypothetical protein
MARMVDLIRDGSAPASILRRAAQGGLSLPTSEAIEILVMLAGQRELGAEAEQTLAGWDEAALIEVASATATPVEVLVYLFQHGAGRPALLTALCENPELPFGEMETAASQADVEVLKALMRSERVRNSSRLLDLMAANSAAHPVRPLLAQWLAMAQGKEAEEVAAHFLVRHAADIAREEGQAFELVAGPEGEDDPLDNLMKRVKKGETTAPPEDLAQLSLLQRIGRMRVGERIKLAVRGNREERMVLIRDRSKLVSLAVLESPKVNDSEMESFAAMKNIQEAVLRVIATKRNYIKNYGVLRTLVNNPKTPLDVALPLLAHLLLKDQRAVAVNKNVNETLRKMALRMWRVKSERKKD